jgi:hypothetical protein
MRPIIVQDGLTITFPGRGKEFDEGVEVGIAAGLMALGQNFTMWLSETSIEQSEELARHMGFKIVFGHRQPGLSLVAFRLASHANLTLVKSQP